MSTLRPIVAFLIAAGVVFAQEPKELRVTAPERAVQIRVQVLYPGGTPLYDSDWKSGNLLDVSDLPFGSYQLRIFSRDLEGRIVERQTILQVTADRITIDPALPADLKLTTTAHDGTTGQIITTSGDLSFRFGDYLNRKDVEAMRLSPEGNLEVKGWIRAGHGILFSDGSTLDSKSSAEKKLHPKSDVAGTGTTNQIPRWTDNMGTLGDSAVSEVSGNVGIGTMTPTGKLHIFGGATSDVFAGMGVDMNAGPAFNFGYGGASFGRSAGFFNVRPDAMASAPNPSLRFMTANVERMIVTSTGDIGIGTSTPGGRFHIFAAPTADVFAGIGTNMSVGPSFNFGYGGASFGRGAGFFNVRPDFSATPPNPSLRFMTANVERMIITNDGSVGIGTSGPTQKLDVEGGDIYVGLGNITTTGNVTAGQTVSAANASITSALSIGSSPGVTASISGGNLYLPQTAGGPTPAGVIMVAGSPWAHSYGTTDVFLGTNAGNFTMTSFYNTGTGYGALHFNAAGYRNASSGAWTLFNNTDGFYNSAFGTESLYSNTMGNNNTAVGGLALYYNTTGSFNTAAGYNALLSNTTGGSNTAIGLNALSGNTSGGINVALGHNALFTNTTGTSNIAIGYYAGSNLTTGNDNIDIGHNGMAAEANTTRIGTSGNQTRTFIAGIRNVTTGSADAVNVMVDSNGQLGTASSSRRYKFDIADMAKFTDRLMQLRPVSFRYKKYGDDGPLQAGLIAEEVAEIYPELVTHDKDGQPETVMYQFLAPMLLNVVQKQQKTIETLERRLEALEKQLAIH